jgi:hypothetical protein
MAKKTTEETPVQIVDAPAEPAVIIETLESKPEPKAIEVKDSDEVSFLKLLYRVQNDGGFGKHLNELIENRIKELQK